MGTLKLGMQLSNWQKNMNPKKTNRRGRSVQGPESVIEQAIIDYLKVRDWYVRRLHGSTFQAGMPDLFACCKMSGANLIRLIEVKDPTRKGDIFTPAQLETFPKLNANGCPVYVMTAATDEEYKKLFKEGNWHEYLREFRKLHGH